MADEEIPTAIPLLTAPSTPPPLVAAPLTAPPSLDTPPATPAATPPVPLTSPPDTPSSGLPTRPSTPEVDDGVSERFTTVLHACLNNTGTISSPLRHSQTAGQEQVQPTARYTKAPQALGALQPNDVYAFRRASPHAMARLQSATAEAMARLDSNNAYRAVALYVALLLQDVNLQTTQGAGPLHREAAGRVCRRLGAVVQQAMEARDARIRARTVPAWYRPVAIGALVALALVLVLLGGLVAALITTRKR
jgi:hypothetical protein